MTTFCVVVVAAANRPSVSVVAALVIIAGPSPRTAFHNSGFMPRTADDNGHVLRPNGPTASGAVLGDAKRFHQNQPVSRSIRDLSRLGCSPSPQYGTLNALWRPRLPTPPRFTTILTAPGCHP